jgi:hypothetical protein
MKINLFNLKNDFTINRLNESDLDNKIYERLLIIENQILKEFLLKQEGKVGIKNLGNEIRYNKVLKSEFSNLKDNQLIIKLTENRRSFIKVFLDNWIENKHSELYFLILEGEFGRNSNIVDKTFISINEVQDELSTFIKYFKPNNLVPSIFFVEFKGFENYNLINMSGYTSIHIK